MAIDPRISGIFYYFEQHTNIESGRTVGRKIGVVQEILCKKLLLTSARIQDSIIYEPKLRGRSGATHKVEFVLLQPNVVVNLAVGSSFEVQTGFTVALTSADQAKQAARLRLTGTKVAAAKGFKAGAVIKASTFIDHSELLLKVVAVEAGAIRLSVLNTSKPVASIESKRVGAQRFSGSDKLGSGIQTIEKAKQASLVALDFDLQYNGTLLIQTAQKQQQNRQFKSIVVLGNGVHWTEHDLAILETYVDYTYLATDAAIIRYADFILALSKKAKADFFKFFMSYFKGMTKTPPDAFAVAAADFALMRPRKAKSLLAAVEAQILPYPVKSV